MEKKKKKIEKEIATFDPEWDAKIRASFSKLGINEIFYGTLYIP